MRYENIDIKPATASLDVETTSLKHETYSLVSNKSSFLSCLAYNESTRTRLQPGLTEDRRPSFIAEILHIHQEEVRAYIRADAHT